MGRKILISIQEVGDIDSELQKINNDVEKKDPITSFVPNDEPPVVLGGGGGLRCMCSATRTCCGPGGLEQ